MRTPDLLRGLALAALVGMAGLTGCGKGAGNAGVTADAVTADKLSTSTAASILDSYLDDQCAAKDAYDRQALGTYRFSANGNFSNAPEGRAAAQSTIAWYNGQIAQKPNCSPVSSMYAGHQQHACQIDGKTLNYHLAVSGGGATSSVTGCGNLPKTSILDLSPDPADPKSTIATFSVSYQMIADGPSGPVKDSSYETGTSWSTAVGQQCQAGFRRLDATGWQLQSLTCESHIAM